MTVKYQYDKVIEPLIFSVILGGSFGPLVTSGTTGILVWILIAVVLIPFYLSRESKRTHSLIEPHLQANKKLVDDVEALSKKEMDVRHVLVGFRNLFETEMQFLDDLTDYTRETFFESFHRSMRKIVTNIFNVFSEGNVDLNNRFQVTYMELDRNDNLLKIKFFENTDHEVPESMSEGIFYKMGEGLAGEAWASLETLIETDTEEAHCFVVRTKREQQFAKSAVSIPVCHRRSGGGTEFFGILNIDASVKGRFQTTDEGHNEIRIKTKPYIELIALLYKIKIKQEAETDKLITESLEAHHIAPEVEHG